MQSNIEPTADIDTTLAPGFRREIRPPGIRKIATEEVLKARVTNGHRKFCMDKRSNFIVSVEPKVATPEPLKLARKLSALPLVRVLRRQRKFAREASTAKHILAKLSGYSAIRPRVAAAQDSALAALGQATAELKARALACEGRLA